MNPFMANKLMTAALRLEMPDLAVDIFEDSFGFCFDTDPAKGENRDNANTEMRYIFCHLLFLFHQLVLFEISCLLLHFFVSFSHHLSLPSSHFISTPSSFSSYAFSFTSFSKNFFFLLFFFLSNYLFSTF